MPWSVCQVGKVVHQFRDSRECDAELWMEIMISFAIVIDKGPHLAGTRVAEKLRGGDGIWELKAHLDNRQPRLLFYERPGTNLLVFVHAFLKKGKSNYGPAIKLAKDRRREVEGGRRQLSPLVH